MIGVFERDLGTTELVCPQCEGSQDIDCPQCGGSGVLYDSGCAGDIALIRFLGVLHRRGQRKRDIDLDLISHPAHRCNALRSSDTDAARPSTADFVKSTLLQMYQSKRDVAEIAALLQVSIDVALIICRRKFEPPVSRVGLRARRGKTAWHREEKP